MSTTGEVIVGIDLGTTNSEVAVHIDGRMEVVADEAGPIMPSYVGLAPDGKLLVGHEARNQYALYPEATVRSIKRKMGSDQKVKLGDHEYLPQEISAMILRQLKQRAEDYLKCPVKKAVITVPAYFSDAQRQATRDAGAIAGLEVLRIINEPTAACLAYEQNATGERTVLAFDLGGGTFDVSIVNVAGDIVEVIASHGDNCLGGDDFDDLIVNTLIESLECADDPLTDTATNRLHHAAELAKIRLTEEVSVPVIEDHLETRSGAQKHLDYTLEREDFEDWSSKLRLRMLEAVRKAMTAADKSARDIDDIVLVGGATRMPMITRMLERELGQRPRHDVHPDLAVAYGAGVMAARLMGEESHRILVDITPYTFGSQVLGTVNGQTTNTCFVPVITAGTPLSATRSIVVNTVYYGQDEADANVFQGEHPDCRQNILVGRFRVTGFPDDLPEGSPVVIRMDLDIDGILRVTAIEKSTGTTCSIVIDNVLAKLSDADIAAAQEKMRELFGDEDNEFVEVDSEPEAGGLAERVAPLLGKLQAAIAEMDKVDSADAQELIIGMSEALADNDEERVDVTRSRICCSMSIAADSLRCPTCRRRASEDDATCARCGTGLTLLLALEDRFRRCLAAGRQALRRMDPGAAEPYFLAALEIHADATAARRGLALAAAMRRDFARALEWRD